MTSYYNLFENTEFIIQNTNTTQTYKSIKQSYQSGGNLSDLKSENQSNKKLLTKSDEEFRNTCKKSYTQRFKHPILQLGGFNIQI